MRILKRQLVKGAAMAVVAGLIFAFPFNLGVTPAHSFSQSPVLPKFVNPLPGLGPNGIPLATKTSVMFNDVKIDKYLLGIAEFTQQLDPVLPGKTTLWGYYDRLNPVHRYLGGVIVARRGIPVMLDVANKLPNHAIIPIDPTIMAGNMVTVGDLPLNRAVTHLHGGDTPWISDGTPMQWSDPKGLKGESFRNVPGTNPPKGSATYYYPMSQSARLLWYHDHAMGITRTNAYSGIASALVLTDDFENYLVTNRLVPDLVGIPLIIQDKSFVPVNVQAQDHGWAWGAPGSLWYPHEYESNIANTAPMGQTPICTPNPTGRWDYGPCVTPPPVSVLSPVANYTLPPVSLVPEFFADTPLVNGAPYPVVSVTQGTFRFRMLNGSQARFWHMNLYQEDPANPGEILLDSLNNPVAGPTMYQIATEGGFLPGVAVHDNTTPIPVDNAGNVIPTGPFNLLIAPAERADVLIDFTGFDGKNFILYSDSPAPFPMGDSRNDYFTGDPDQTLIGGAPTTLKGQGPNTRTVMKFIVPAGAANNGFIVDKVALDTALSNNYGAGNPGVAAQQPPFLFPPANFPFTGKPDRFLTLNEDFDEFGRLIQTIGTTTSQVLNNQGLPTWGIPYVMDPTETPQAGATEIWQIANLTGDTHPIHFHLVNVQVIQRQDFSAGPSIPGGVIALGPALPTPPDDNEKGWKETVRMNPGQVTTVIMKFDLPKVPFTLKPNVREVGIAGHEYVWHCHILEHEEHDMMRPLIVQGNSPLGAFPATQTGNLLPVDYAIYNGVPPYTVTSDNAFFPPFPNKVKVSGGKFIVPVLQSLFIKNPPVINFTITDSAGNKDNVSLNLKH